MKIGIPKEIKNNENRVAITTAGVKTLTEAGHRVYIENYAGIGSGISNQDYISAGAEILDDVEELFDNVEMIMKVKEPLSQEYNYFHQGQVLFTYLHLADAFGMEHLPLSEVLSEFKI